MRKNEKKSKELYPTIEVSPSVYKFIKKHSLGAIMVMEMIIGNNLSHLERLTDLVIEGENGKQYLIREVCEIYEK